MAVVSYSDSYQSKPSKQLKAQLAARAAITVEPKLRFSDTGDYLAGVAATVLAVGGSIALFWFF